MAENEEPWLTTRQNRGIIPGQETLRQWRLKANRRAKKKGAQWACSICKRPGKGKRSTIRIRHRDGDRFQRQVCYSCVASIVAYIKQLETRSAGSKLPIYED